MVKKLLVTVQLVLFAVLLLVLATKLLFNVAA